MKWVLGSRFYRRPALVVAPELLGKYLVGIGEGGEVARKITEVEAYTGIKDLASHSSRGLTKRTKALFEAGGVWYVYLVYGMHYMLNIVVGERGSGDAILIRGVEGVSGPGRVAKLFKVNKEYYGLKASLETGLYIEDRGKIILNKDIKKSARIGVDYAGPIWSKKLYRFYLAK